MHKVAIWIILQLVASGGDAYTTHIGLQGRHFERNPIARPFMHTTGGQVVFFGGQTAVKIAVPVILRHQHHNKLADIFSVAGIAENAYATASNVKELRK